MSLSTRTIRRPLVSVAILLASACGPTDFVRDDPEEFRRIVAEGVLLRRLATGMEFTEGPVWVDRDGGSLIFSDLRAGKLMKWSEAEGLTTFRDPSPHPNGNTLDPEGRLVTCEHESRRVSRTEADGTVITLVDAWNGLRLNSPNDLVFHSDGSLWFTDPPYGLKGEEQDIDSQNVFRWEPESGSLRPVVRDFHRPNGLCFSPDERTLYVSDSGDPEHIRAFDVAPDGTLSGDRVFYETRPGVPDGMCCDREGRLYSTAADGVHIHHPDGRRIGKILVPEETTNVCFGGSHQRTLFITAESSIYSIELMALGR